MTNIFNVIFQKNLESCFQQNIINNNMEFICNEGEECNFYNISAKIKGSFQCLQYLDKKKLKNNIKVDLSRYFSEISENGGIKGNSQLYELVALTMQKIDENDIGGDIYNIVSSQLINQANFKNSNTGSTKNINIDVDFGSVVINYIDKNIIDSKIKTLLINLSEEETKYKNKQKKNISDILDIVLISSIVVISKFIYYTF